VIGVIPKSGQHEVVEEFFELFKTSWEWYVPGRAYDVVIATASDWGEIEAKLLLVYGSDEKAVDQRLAISVVGRHEETMLRHRDILVPVYGGLTTFSTSSFSSVCLESDSGVAGVKIQHSGQTVLRLGFDLFEEVRFLLTTGQPVRNSQIPTLDKHIELLREWILEAGIGFVEILPSPAGYRFCVSLTHDIDFVGIRNHKFDHTMWGFLYRATVGAVVNFLRGRLSLRQVMKCWRAVLSLPGVLLGWLEDFWEPFAWYLEVEKNLPATYFMIPFPGRPGSNVFVAHPSRRAARYDFASLSPWMTTLTKAGCEIGVHGIDAWHSEERGREERGRIASFTHESSVGVRMHWLLRNEQTFQALEGAGYVYDSTVGYNDTIGYRSGTAQCFRPLGAKELIELPLHMQDGALFYPTNLDLPQSEAWKLCQNLTNHAKTAGGVLTVLWHDRSHAPERFWGEFYKRLVEALKSSSAWFGTALQVVTWFRKRREIKFERMEATLSSSRLQYSGVEIHPPVKIRVYPPRGVAKSDSQSEAMPRFRDIAWDGTSNKVNELVQAALVSSAHQQHGMEYGRLLTGSLQ